MKQTPMQQTYLVKLVYRIDNQSGMKSADFDEQYRLVFAASEEEAQAKAKIIGVKNESTMLCEDGRSISWCFVDNTLVKRIDCGTDGVELFSQTVTAEDAHQYTSFIHHQAESIWQQTVVPNEVKGE